MAVPILLIGLIGVAIWFVWYLAGNQIMLGARFLRAGEAYAIGMTTRQPEYTALAGALVRMRAANPDYEAMRPVIAALAPIQAKMKPAMKATMAAELANIPKVFNDASIKKEAASKSASWYLTGAASDAVAPYTRWVWIPILGLLVLWALLRKEAVGFKNRHSLESLMHAQARQWPVILPAVRFNPTKHSHRRPGDALPKELPAFAEALSPEEWVAFNRVGLKNGSPDRDGIRRAFVAQLGQPFRGIDALPTHQRALIAAFALKGARRRDDADTMLGELAAAWTPEKGLVLDKPLAEKVEKILADKSMMGDVLEIMNQHAFVTTAILGLLMWARERGGVLAAATFLWIRGHDRALWYPLNNLGRRAFHPEASGAMAHFLAERNAAANAGAPRGARAMPLQIPRVETAIDAVLQYLVRAKPVIPPVDDAPPLPQAQQPKAKGKKRA